MSKVNIEHKSKEFYSEYRELCDKYGMHLDFRTEYDYDCEENLVYVGTESVLISNETGEVIDYIDTLENNELYEEEYMNGEFYN